VTPSLVFLLDLIQDVAVCRPVATFAKRETKYQLIFCVTADFRKRDSGSYWYREIKELCHSLQAEVFDLTDVADIVFLLTSKCGILISSSESFLPAHRFCNEAFLACPSSFLRVTLQHGLECIGFNHNEAHNRFWSHYIGLGCDVAGSWFEIDNLHSVRPDQRSKIMPLGPSIGLDGPPNASRRVTQLRRPDLFGLVCENLHSVRFRGAGVAPSFLESFARFADRLGELGGSVELRPHPAGRYTERKNVALPNNVSRNSTPLYKQTLEKFLFCISAPSSVIFDMVWAGVPVAVWTTSSNNLDVGIYQNLTLVRNDHEWLEFALACAEDPGPFLSAQADFLRSLGIPSDIPGRYRKLFSLVLPFVR
jgi:hypothetical protein